MRTSQYKVQITINATHRTSNANRHVLRYLCTPLFDQITLCLPGPGLEGMAQVACQPEQPGGTGGSTGCRLIAAEGAGQLGGGSMLCSAAGGLFAYHWVAMLVLYHGGGSWIGALLFARRQAAHGAQELLAIGFYAALISHLSTRWLEGCVYVHRQMSADDEVLRRSSLGGVR